MRRDSKGQPPVRIPQDGASAMGKSLEGDSLIAGKMNDDMYE